MPANIRAGGVRIDISANERPYTAALQRVERANQRLARSQLAVQGVYPRGNMLVQQFTSSIRSSLVATAAYAAGVEGLRRVIGGSIEESLEWEKRLIAVQKTTGLTDAETDRLGDRFDRLLTKTSALQRPLPVVRENLLQIAEVAGQMRIQGVPDILEFTETVALLELTTDLAGDAAANAVGIIVSNTRTGVREIRKIGSVLTALGNEFRGGESDIIVRAEEIARSTAEFRLAGEDVLAFGAFFSQFGTRAEKTGTVLQRTFRALSNAAGEAASGNLDKLVAVSNAAGVSLEDLQGAITTGDWTRAIRILGDALANLPSVGTTAELSRGGLLTFLFGGDTPPTRIAEILGLVAENSDELTRALRRAREEFNQPIALLEEAGKFAEARALRLLAVQNQLASQARVVGDAFNTVFVPVAENFRALEVGIAATAIALGTGFTRRRIARARQTAIVNTEVAQTTLRTARATLTDVEARRANIRAAVLEARTLERGSAKRIAALNQSRRAREAHRKAVVDAQASEEALQRTGIRGLRVLAEDRAATDAAARAEVQRLRVLAQRNRANQRFARELPQTVQNRVRQQAAAISRDLAVAEESATQAARAHALAQRQLTRSFRITNRIARVSTGLFNALGGAYGVAISAILVGIPVLLQWSKAAEDTVTEDLISRLRQMREEANRTTSGLTNNAFTLQQATDRIAGLRAQQQLLIAESERRIRFFANRDSNIFTIAGIHLYERFFGAQRDALATARRIATLEKDSAAARAALSDETEQAAEKNKGLIETFRELDLSLESPTRKIRAYLDQLARADNIRTRRLRLQESLVGDSQFDTTVSLARFDRRVELERRLAGAQAARTRRAQELATASRNALAAEHERNRFLEGTQEREGAQKQLENAVNINKQSQRRLNFAEAELAFAKEQLKVDLASVEAGVRAEFNLRRTRALTGAVHTDPANIRASRAEADAFVRTTQEQVAANARRNDQLRQLIGLQDEERAGRQAQITLEETINARRKAALQDFRDTLSRLRDATDLVDRLAAGLSDTPSERDTQALTRARESREALVQSRLEALALVQALDVSNPKVLQLLANVAENAREYARLTREQGGLFKLATELATSGVRAIEDSLVTLVSRGTVSFRDFTRAILADMSRIIIRATITANFLKALGFDASGTLTDRGLLGFLGIVRGVQPTEQQHTGGVVGQGVRRRGAIRGDEQAVILKRGEEILRRDDWRHRYNLNSAPRFHAGGVVGGSGTGTAPPPPMYLNFENRGTQKQVVDTRQRFDGKAWVTTVILDDVRRNGPITKAYSSRFRR